MRLRNAALQSDERAWGLVLQGHLSVPAILHNILAGGTKLDQLHVVRFETHRFRACELLVSLGIAAETLHGQFDFHQFLRRNIFNQIYPDHTSSLESSCRFWVLVWQTTDWHRVTRKVEAMPVSFIL